MGDLLLAPLPPSLYILRVFQHIPEPNSLNQCPIDNHSGNFWVFFSKMPYLSVLMYIYTSFSLNKLLKMEQVDYKLLIGFLYLLPTALCSRRMDVPPPPVPSAHYIITEDSQSDFLKAEAAEMRVSVLTV
jgi:hypothetical protein